MINGTASKPVCGSCNCDNFQVQQSGKILCLGCGLETDPNGAGKPGDHVNARFSVWTSIARFAWVMYVLVALIVLAVGYALGLLGMLWGALVSGFGYLTGLFGKIAAKPQDELHLPNEVFNCTGAQQRAVGQAAFNKTLRIFEREKTRCNHSICPYWLAFQEEINGYQVDGKPCGFVNEAKKKGVRKCAPCANDIMSKFYPADSDLPKLTNASTCATAEDMTVCEKHNERLAGHAVTVSRTNADYLLEIDRLKPNDEELALRKDMQHVRTEMDLFVNHFMFQSVNSTDALVHINATGVLRNMVKDSDNFMLKQLINFNCLKDVTGFSPETRAEFEQLCDTKSKIVDILPSTAEIEQMESEKRQREEDEAREKQKELYPAVQAFVTLNRLPLNDYFLQWRPEWLVNIIAKVQENFPTEMVTAAMIVLQAALNQPEEAQKTLTHSMSQASAASGRFAHFTKRVSGAVATQMQMQMVSLSASPGSGPTA